jgi:SAM-dependent methyltransferase
VHDTQAFSFGRNWQLFVDKHFNEERVSIAKRHLLDFLDLPDLKGKYFLDAGCGSGLSSLAAWDAGAERIISFDIDPFSVKTTERLRELRGNPPGWTVMQGSVLDRSFMTTLEPADVVYSWGVLHHTGRMWEAIRNVASLLKEDSLFYIALYVTTAKSGYWLQQKRKYNQASDFRKRLMECYYVGRHVLTPKIVRLQNPFRFILNYRARRGMEFMTDVRDWLGGYPYEDATIQEVVCFCHKNHRLALVNINAGSAFAEYLFRPQA